MALDTTTRATDCRLFSSFLLPSQIKGAITSSLFVDSKQLLVIGTSTGHLLVYKTAPINSFPSFILQKHKGGITALCYCETNQLIFAGSADFKISVYDLSVRDDDQKCIQVLIGHKGTITSLVAEDGFLFSSSRDSKVKVWRSDDACKDFLQPVYFCFQTLSIPGIGWSTSVAYTRVSRIAETARLYVGDSVGAVVLFSLQGPLGSQRFFPVKSAFENHRLIVSHLSFLPRDSSLITLSFDGQMRIINTLSEAASTRFSNPFNTRFSSLALSPSRKELYLSDFGGRLFIWGLGEDACLHTEVLTPHQGILAISAHKSREKYIGDILVVTAEQEVQFWNVLRSTQHKQFSGHTGALIGMAVDEISNNDFGAKLFTVGLDNTVKRWDAIDLACRATLKLSLGAHVQPTAIAASQTTHVVFVGNDDGSLTVLNPFSSRQMHLKGHTSAITDIQLVPTGTREYLFTCSLDGCVCVFDVTVDPLRLAKLYVKIRVDECELFTVVFNPSTKIILSAGAKGVVFAHQLSSSGVCVAQMNSGDGVAVNHMCLDGNLLIAGREDGIVDVWDSVGHTYLQTFSANGLAATEPNQPILRIQQFKAGHVVLIREESHIVSLFNYMEELEVLRFKHEGSVFRSLCIPPNSSKILAGSETGGVFIFVQEEEEEEAGADNGEDAEEKMAETAPPPLPSSQPLSLSPSLPSHPSSIHSSSLPSPERHSQSVL